MKSCNFPFSRRSRYNIRSVYKRPLFIGVRMKRFLWLCVIVFLFLICVGCGDTYRPVIIPNPPKFPDVTPTRAGVGQVKFLPLSAVLIAYEPGAVDCAITE